MLGSRPAGKAPVDKRFKWMMYYIILIMQEDVHSPRESSQRTNGADGGHECRCDDVKDCAANAGISRLEMHICYILM